MIRIIPLPEFLDMLSDVSILLVIIAATLVIISEMLSSYYGRVNIRMNKRRVRRAALATSALFFITITIRVINMITPVT